MVTKKSCRLFQNFLVRFSLFSCLLTFPHLAHAVPGIEKDLLSFEIQKAFDEEQNSKSQLVYRDGKTTLSGESFILAPSDPVFGEGWIDPKGIIWYDIVLDENSIPLKMNYETAKKLCADYDSRLPSLDEVGMLENWFSGSFHTKRRHYVPQIFSNHLDKHFWTYDDWISESTYTKVFILSKGWLADLRVTSKSHVRCVRQFTRSDGQ